MRSFRALAITLATLTSVDLTTARAEPPAASLAMRERPPVSTGRRVLATTLAVIPGILVRGTGSYLVHDKATAKPLLTYAAIGLGLMAIGGATVGITGGNPYLLVPFVPMLVGGTGMFMQTWFADIMNAAGVHGTGAPRARTPWSVEVGGVWVKDAYRDRALLRGTARAVEGRLEVLGSGYISHDQHYRAGDLGVRARLLGSVASDGAPTERNNFLELRTTARLRDDSDDHVQVATIEAELAARVDLDTVSASLAGSFAELGLGGGLERAAFATEDEKGGLLLGRFAYGMYLGRRGEAQLFYDHRRDSFAGGIAAYRAAGFVGSVGAIADARVSGPWALHAELEIGSAWVTTLGIRYQGGQR